MASTAGPPGPAPAPSSAEMGALPPSAELLDYYRQRVGEFEGEREEWLRQVERLSVSHEEQHKVEWELKKRRDEVRELQKALSDAHVYLFEERQRLLELQAENDELKLQELDDRRRIQHLLALTRPVEQEITYLRNQRPDAMVYYPRGGAAAGPHARPGGAAAPQPLQASSVANARAGAAGSPGAAGASPAGGSGGGCERVMRTVYMPTANTDALMLKVESLQAQLDEAKQFGAERVAALLEDRRARELEAEAARESAGAASALLAARLQRAEKGLMDTTKALVLTKRRAAEADATALERVAAAEAALAKERAARGADAASAEAATSAQRAAAESEKEAFVAEFRGQLKTREEELRNMEAIHAAVRRQWEQRIAELEAKYARLREQYRALEYRRALDLEGFTADVTLLRKQTAAVDRRLTASRLADRLDDGERLDGLLETLARRASPRAAAPAGGARWPGTAPQRGGAPRSAGRPGAGVPGGCGTIGEVAQELGHLRAELAGTEGRLDQATRAARQEAAAAAEHGP